MAPLLRLAATDVKTAATVVAGTAGVAIASKIASRGCARSVESGVVREAAKDLGRVGISGFERAAIRESVGETERFGTWSVGKAARLEPGAPAKPLDRLLPFEKDGARSFGKIPNIEPPRPGHLRHLSNDFLTRKVGEGATESALKESRVVLYDASGNPIVTDSIAARATELEYRRNAARILDEVLQDIPSSSNMSDTKLREALVKALDSHKSKLTYDLNVSTGMMKLQLATKGGKITGEFNAYSVAKVAIAATSAGVGAKYILQHKRDAPQDQDKESGCEDDEPVSPEPIAP
jgi:hypothetical protein